MSAEHTPHSELLAIVQLALQGDVSMPTYLNDSQKRGLVALQSLEEQHEALLAERDDDDRPHLLPRRELWARVRSAEEQHEVLAASERGAWAARDELQEQLETLREAAEIVARDGTTNQWAAGLLQEALNPASVPENEA